MKLIEKPKPREYDPYAIMYIKLLPDDGLILQHLYDNGEAAKEFFLSLPKEKLEFRYAPDKWTVKKILQHIIDDERIYSHRALRFANYSTILQGMNSAIVVLLKNDI